MGHGLFSDSSEVYRVSTSLLPSAVHKMTSRIDREKVKSLQDKHQSILCDLLKDDDNKYCVDCDAKGEYHVVKKLCCHSETESVSLTD